MDVITFSVDLITTSGLSILLHGVISLSDVKSYDKGIYLSISSVYNRLDQWNFH